MAPPPEVFFASQHVDASGMVLSSLHEESGLGPNLSEPRSSIDQTNRAGPLGKPFVKLPRTDCAILAKNEIRLPTNSLTDHVKSSLS